MRARVHVHRPVPIDRPSSRGMPSRYVYLGTGTCMRPGGGGPREAIRAPGGSYVLISKGIYETFCVNPEPSTEQAPQSA